MWIALYVNGLGFFKPVGPFLSKLDAEQWILDNVTDPRLWSAWKLHDPIERLVGM